MSKFSIRRVRVYIDFNYVVSDIYELASKYLEVEVKNSYELHNNFLIPATRGKFDDVSSFPFLEAGFKYECLNLFEYLNNNISEHCWKLITLDSPALTKNIDLQKRLWLEAHIADCKLITFKSKIQKNSICGDESTSTHCNILVDGDNSFSKKWIETGNSFIRHESFDKTLEKLKKIIDEKVRI